jgi:tRNA modification GTPase
MPAAILVGRRVSPIEALAVLRVPRLLKQLSQDLSTIVAVATPPGRGGIGIVRLSGPDARRIGTALTSRRTPFAPRRATLARLANASDEVVVTFFAAPGSYTGEDVVEISAHGSQVVLREIVAAAVAGGARVASPGEFTLRAFLNGRLDLVQAEAVNDLVNAVTPLQAKAAFDQLQGTLTRSIAAIDAQLLDLVARLEASVDFPDEGYHFIAPDEIGRALDNVLASTAALIAQSRQGRLVREGLQVAIVGKPNAGKSSLFNALVGAPRAIVTDVPGTTRDLVTETADLAGLRVTFVDTAGLRTTSDVVESEGVDRSKGAIASADLVLVVLDSSRSLDESDRQAMSQSIETKRIIVQNKSDLPVVWDVDQIAFQGPESNPNGDVCVRTSSVTGDGIDALRNRIAELVDATMPGERPEITNVRHIALVERAHAALLRAREAAVNQGAAISEEFVLADLQEARESLEEIVGKRTPDDVLSHIFATFCIGK